MGFRQYFKVFKNRPRPLWWFLTLLLLSFHQATILTYADFGRAAITANIDQIPGAHIQNALVLSHIKQLGISQISASLLGHTISLLFIQLVPAIVYKCFESSSERWGFALTIWLLPALLTFPTLIGPVVWLMSPLFAITTFFPGFMFTAHQWHKEDFAEGLIFTLGVIGWFNLFWLGLFIKSRFFSKTR